MRDIEIENKWVERISACRSGSQTVRGFCLGHGLKFSAYYYWQKVLKQRRPEIFAQGGHVSKAVEEKILSRKEKVPKKPRFERVDLVPGAKADVEITLPNNFRLNCSENIEAACLENILSVLEARSC